MCVCWVAIPYRGLSLSPSILQFNNISRTSQFLYPYGLISHFHFPLPSSSHSCPNLVWHTALHISLLSLYSLVVVHRTLFFPKFDYFFLISCSASFFPHFLVFLAKCIAKQVCQYVSILTRMLTWYFDSLKQYTSKFDRSLSFSIHQKRIMHLSEDIRQPNIFVLFNKGKDP